MELTPISERVYNVLMIINNNVNQIKYNLGIINEKIEQSARKVGRNPTEISLVAVTKTIPSEKIQAAVDAGIKVIGENRVQEAILKYPDIGNRVEWHLIGHLQTNKIKKVLEIFSMIQSIDSLYLAQEVEKRASSVNKIMPVLIEVNTSGEMTKFGVEQSQLSDLTKDILNLPHLKLIGLMTIGPGLAIEDKEQSRPCFQMLYQLRQKLEHQFSINLPYLSMGMSSDFEVGIEEGSNMVRIGTAIFGSRSK
jgi:pyridoxal phosphate enzyme (YggS family)